MIRKLRILARLLKDYGFVNVLMYSIFKVIPESSNLIKRRLNIINSVYDYQSWVSYGGMRHPPAENGNQKKTFIWFVPDWTNVWGGGHYTLFRFAHHFSKNNIRNIIYIYDNSRHVSPIYLECQLKSALEGSNLEVITDPKLLPFCDAAFATTWQSAYFVRAFNFAKEKFYFMQDYESTFYAHGTSSMQANATYSFGFHGITGGGWLKKCYESHGGIAKNYLFAADRKIFYPKDLQVRSAVKKVFFYGRPSTERRCYDLGITALMKISELFPDIEIVIAGLDLKTRPPFKATLLGNMTLEETGNLYRTCDIGIAFSATNLSYLPVELMASGVPVISNNGPHIEWHCKNGVNSYLVDPVPTAILEAFVKLYEDRELRQKLVDGGLETMKSLTWDDQMSQIYEYVDKNLQ
jgi:O-antigen biosynthesis protein